jgi:hypothetical protein|tara:strand:+ start:164 stop:289 length:126 start_codon:yes stop_codon:yes gene_type:complete
MDDQKATIFLFILTVRSAGSPLWAADIPNDLVGTKSKRKTK